MYKLQTRRRGGESTGRRSRSQGRRENNARWSRTWKRQNSGAAGPGRAGARAGPRVEQRTSAEPWAAADQRRSTSRWRRRGRSPARKIRPTGCGDGSGPTRCGGGAARVGGGGGNARREIGGQRGDDCGACRCDYGGGRGVSTLIVRNFIADWTKQTHYNGIGLDFNKNTL
jgi:hypothetical protein